LFWSYKTGHIKAVVLLACSTGHKSGLGQSCGENNTMNEAPEDLSGSMTGTIPERRPFSGTGHRGIPLS